MVIFNLQKLSGQETMPEEDTELWTSAQLKIDVLEDWRIDVEQQLRLDDHFSSFHQYFSELGIRYKINKYFDLKAQYRYSVTDEEHNEGRISLDFGAEYDIKDFPVDILYRLRLQDEKIEYTGQKKTYMRHRIGIDYNMSKLVDPYFEYESFFKFNQKNEFRRNRYTLGLQWKLNKKAELVTFGRYQKEFNVKAPKSVFIVGLGYSYDLDLRKKQN